MSRERSRETSSVYGPASLFASFVIAAYCCAAPAKSAPSSPGSCGGTAWSWSIRSSSRAIVLSAAWTSAETEVPYVCSAHAVCAEVTVRGRAPSKFSGCGDCRPASMQ